jgi:hypothetical protein
MPELLVIALSFVGIFLVGLAFSALRLIKNVTQFIAVSLLVLFLIVWANRSFNPALGDLAIFSSNRQPSAQNGSGVSQTDRPLFSQPTTQDYQRTGRDLLTGFTSSVGNVSDSIDTFVYGPQAKIGWQTLPEKLPADSSLKQTPGQAGERSIVAPRTGAGTGAGTGARTGTDTRQAPGTPSTPRPTSQRPISAWW